MLNIINKLFSSISVEINTLIPIVMRINAEENAKKVKDERF